MLLFYLLKLSKQNLLNWFLSYNFFISVYFWQFKNIIDKNFILDLAYSKYCAVLKLVKNVVVLRKAIFDNRHGTTIQYVEICKPLPTYVLEEYVP